MRKMIFPFNPISEKEFLLNWLKRLSMLSVPMLAKQLGVPEAEVMDHPQFEVEANKMIDRITF